jgi:hypothetical protein
MVSRSLKFHKDTHYQCTYSKIVPSNFTTCQSQIARNNVILDLHTGYAGWNAVCLMLFPTNCDQKWGKFTRTNKYCSDTIIHFPPWVWIYEIRYGRHQVPRGIHGAGSQGTFVKKLAENKIPKMEVTNAGDNSDRAYPDMSIRMQIWKIMRCFTNMSPFAYGHGPLSRCLSGPWDCTKWLYFKVWNQA